MIECPTEHCGVPAAVRTGVQVTGCAMIEFEIQDMTCGHCVSTLTKALKAVDPAAELQFDLAAHRLSIQPGQTDRAALQAAIERAGFTPVAC